MKKRITVTVDRELLAWLDSRVVSKEYANRSHAMEVFIRKKIENEGTYNHNP